MKNNMLKQEAQYVFPPPNIQINKGFDRTLNGASYFTILLLLLAFKIHPVGTEIFHAEEQMDGRIQGITDMTQLIVSFRSLVNVLNY
jgi:hypothetical protein